MELDLTLHARVALTIAMIGYSFGTVKADFNATHATNPNWTPHARFHLVWQICSYCGLGMVSLCLIWWPGAFATERLVIAAAIATMIFLSFFAALATMRVFGGSTFDENGYPPFKAPVPLFSERWDLNVTVFSAFTILTLIVFGAIIVG